MAKKKRGPVVKTSVASASCSLFATFATVCPLCRVEIPAKTQHTCGTTSSVDRSVVADSLVKAFGE